MNKMVKIAIVLVALTAVFSFAQEGGGGFRMGFQGGFGGDNGSIGLLFNLGNGLELGLGVSISSKSREVTTESSGPSTTDENSAFVWAIAPSVSYEIGKKDLISYGAGLDVAIASWSRTQTSGGTSVTIKPDGITMGFLPNFYIQVEPVKNFVVGLKTGIMILMPGKEVDDQSPAYKETTTKTDIDTATQLFVSFYL